MTEHVAIVNSSYIAELDVDLPMGTKLYAAPVVSPDVGLMKLIIEQKVGSIALLESMLDSAQAENQSLKQQLTYATSEINELREHSNFRQQEYDRQVEMARSVKTELEAARKDAERYRWLRWTGDSEIYLHNQHGVDNCAQLGCECLDAIIDAAIEQAKGGTS